MSLLTDTDLAKLLSTDRDWTDKDTLHIYPYEENCLTPVGYDVRVGKQYASAIDAKIYKLDENEPVIIIPGDTVLITTLENIEMPSSRKYSAFITSKVSKVSQGLSHISTNIDPDWRGNLIAIHNPSHSSVTLKYGETFCTLNFIENKSASTKECGKEPGRTDVLLKNFVEDVKETREREKKIEKRRNLLNLTLKAILILIPCSIGYFLFGSEPGFIAMTALGVGLAGNISVSKR